MMTLTNNQKRPQKTKTPKSGVHPRGKPKLIHVKLVSKTSA
jgi:hypothetical protein